MARTARLATLAILPALLLAACGSSGDDAKTKGAGDAAVNGSLGDEIMVDPDLASQNQANSAVAAGRGDGALPATALTPEALQRARAKALKLVGGPGMLRKAPKASDAGGTLPPDAALSKAGAAAGSPDGATNCADKAEYTMKWADKLPATFPVYPDGAVQEAAGTDDAPCALRVVNFLTALPIDDVMDFYYTRATHAGFSTQRVLDDGDDVLGGVKGAASYVIYARQHKGGGTEVDLVTNGG